MTSHLPRGQPGFVLKTRTGRHGRGGIGSRALGQWHVDPKPLGAVAERFYANQSIYFGRRDEYLRLFDQARLLPVGYVDHSPNMAQTFKDTTRVLRTYRPQLKQEFGWIVSRLWPEVPGGLYVPTLRNLRYVHVVGGRRHGG